MEREAGVSISRSVVCKSIHLNLPPCNEHIPSSNIERKREREKEREKEKERERERKRERNKKRKRKREK